MQTRARALAATGAAALLLVLTGCGGDAPAKADPKACRAVMEKRFVENTADGTVPPECKGVDTEVVAGFVEDIFNAHIGDATRDAVKQLEDEQGDGMKVTVEDPPTPSP
ncbi:hypothetical protein OH809_08185 [Streptomyces sp. NBC_00873]|uniref:hypothetical protein n=1 Tax=unclassified Streptomyces TaxID=2593676 RepID=UPI00386B3983|nr:hypothetical protein OH809_08185 [Streptomyces sp. NBC_00873]WTA47306.1 hypothetical protein OH821_35620 [Streptomyces sp. NBC_00842]